MLPHILLLTSTSLARKRANSQLTCATARPGDQTAIAAASSAATCIDGLNSLHVGDRQGWCWQAWGSGQGGCSVHDLECHRERIHAVRMAVSMGRRRLGAPRTAASGRSPGTQRAPTCTRASEADSRPGGSSCRGSPCHCTHGHLVWVQVCTTTAEIGTAESGAGVMRTPQIRTLPALSDVKFGDNCEGTVANLLILACTQRTPIT